MLFDYRRLERFVVPLLVVSFVLLVLVLVPPFGQAINGTRRWLRVGPVSFQPVELAKFSLVLYLASFLARRRGGHRRLQPGLAPAAARGGRHGRAHPAPARPGQRLVLVILTLALAYLAGARVSTWALIAGAALPLVRGGHRA